MTLFKRTIPVLIAFLVGAWFAISFVIPTHLAEQTEGWGANWVKILYGFAYLLGLYSLTHLHWMRIKRRNPGWGYSLLVYAGLIPMVVVGLAGEVQTVAGLVTGTAVELPVAKQMLMEGDPGFTGTYTSGFTWFFDYVYTPSSQTMFSLLAFFIASAAYRTFRARTWEAGFLLVAAIFVMFGQVPIANLAHPFFPELADWIMAFPNMAAKRAILLGVSLGTVATALRIIFGIERAYLGGE